MTRMEAFRFKTYKVLLRREMEARKDTAYQVTLTRMTAKELGEKAAEHVRGVRFTNTARDVRLLTEPGEHYDAEFDILWRGQDLPYVVSRYSATFLANIVKTVVSPAMMDEALRRLDTLPGGKRVWQDL